MNRNLVLGVVFTQVAFAGGCGGAGPKSAPAARVPDAFVLRIDVVRIGKQSDSGRDWDGPEPERDAGAGCRVLVAGVMMLEPMLSPLSALCGLGGGEQRERRAEAPDLRLRLAVGSDVAYETWVVPDTSSQSLQYEFVVPSAAIPPDGLRLEVWDDDRNRESELIGDKRLSLQDLTDAYRSATKLLPVAGGAIQQLDIVVSAYQPIATTKISRRANDVPVRIAQPVRAGEVLSVRASGRFTVGSWFDRSLDPAGYPGGSARSYNLESFERKPHACAIALIAKGTNVEGEAVGTASTFVARHAGALSVGLNDRDPSNNQGQVTFEISRRAPTAEDWLRGGRAR